MRHVANPIYDDQHLLHIKDSEYGNTPIQKLILERLTMAAADPEVRQTMNVEDEVLSALERRDNKIAKAHTAGNRKKGKADCPDGRADSITDRADSITDRADSDPYKITHRQWTNS